MAFELFKSEKTDKYHFRLKAANGQFILASEAYETKAAASNGIAAVQKNASADNFECRTATDDSTYFVLKAANGQVIGKSQMYKSQSGCDNGMKSVIENAASEVKDLTV